MAKDTQKLSWVGLRKAVAKATGTDSKEVALFLQNLVSVLSQTLQSGESIRISGLGTFRIQAVADRKSVNVKTGESIVIPGYNKIVFDMESSLQEKLNMRPSLLPDNDPIHKLSEQADEILDILADIGQGPKAEVVSAPLEIEETPKAKEEEIEIPPTPQEEEQTIEEPTLQEEEQTPVVPAMEDIPIEETGVAPIVHPSSVPPTQEGEDETPNEVISPLNVIDIQSPKPPKPPFRPWLVAGITMLVFCILLIGGYIFLQHKLEMWVYHLQDKMDGGSSTTQVEETPTLSTPTDSLATDTMSVDTLSVVDAEDISNSTTADNQRTYTEFIATEQLAQDSRLAWVAKKYYGEKKLWVFIYEANMDHLSNPNNIAPGTEIRVPKLSDELMDVNNPVTLQIIHELETKFLN